VRVGKRTGGAKESTPVGATARSKQFCANWATALVPGAANVVAVGALDERPSRVVTFQGDTTALAGLRAALPWLGGNLLHAAAWDRDFAFGKGWQGCKFCSLVGTSGRIQLTDDALRHKWHFGVLDDEVVCCHHLFLAFINFLVCH